MIHKFKLYGTNVVLDVYSGAVYVVDDIVYDVIDLIKINDNTGLQKSLSEDIMDKLKAKYKEDVINEAYSEILELEQRGLLFSKDDNEAFVKYLDREPVIKALCLHISHDCNMRCDYCFASTGNFKGQRLLMSNEIGRKAIDFVIEKSQNRKNIEIDFFGGEPLMNFEVVKDIVDYAADKGEKYGKDFRFTLTTNGTLLSDEIIDFINDKIYNIVLSIDGRKEIHDRMRKNIADEGTYDKIIAKYIDIANSRNQDNYYVRGTYTRNNLDFSKDVIHLADLGFKQISVEPVVADSKEDYSIREEDLPVLFEEYEKLSYEYVRRRKNGQGFNFFHFMIDLSQGPCVIKKIQGCGSGSEYLAITPEGDIYPCHQFVGNTDYKMGNVIEGNLNEKIMQAFKKNNIYSKEKCKACWAKFYCSGGCIANSLKVNGDINVPYSIGCELQKKRIECALFIKCAMEGNNTL